MDASVARASVREHSTLPTAWYKSYADAFMIFSLFENSVKEDLSDDVLMIG